MWWVWAPPLPGGGGFGGGGVISSEPRRRGQGYPYPHPGPLPKGEGGLRWPHPLNAPAPLPFGPSGEGPGVRNNFFSGALAIVSRPLAVTSSILSHGFNFWTHLEPFGRAQSRARTAFA